MKGKVVLVRFPFDDLMTVSADLLLRELGSLPAAGQREVARKLRRLFELHAVRPRRRSGKRPSPSSPT